MDKQRKEKITQLSKRLKNVGPKLAEKLIDCGIDSPEKLTKLGAKAAYRKMYSQGDKYGDFNAAYLYALEGAIQNCDWLEIDQAVKDDFKKFAQDLQSKKILLSGDNN